MKQQCQFEDFYTNPHYYTLKQQIEKGNLTIQQLQNPFSQIESQNDKREKSFILDCSNKQKMPQQYNSLYDKHLTNFLSKVTTISALKKTGVIQKHEINGNSLFIYENSSSHPTIQRKRQIQLPENFFIDRTKSKSFHNRKQSTDKLPQLSYRDEQKDEQQQQSIKNQNVERQSYVQFSNMRQEKLNYSTDNKERYLNEQKQSEQGDNQKIRSIIQIRTKQRLIKSNNSSPTRTTLQTTCETKQNNTKLHYDHFKQRNASSEQIGVYKPQDIYNSEIKRFQDSQKSFRSENFIKKPSTSNHSYIKRSDISLASSNNQNILEQKYKLQKDDVKENTNQNIQQNLISPKLQTPKIQNKVKTNVSSLKIVGPYQQIKKVFQNGQRGEENKQQQDQKNSQEITKEEFMSMMQRYKEKAEQNLNLQIKFKAINNQQLNTNENEQNLNGIEQQKEGNQVQNDNYEQKYKSIKSQNINSDKENNIQQ